MAGNAGDLVAGRQAGVEEERLAEFHLGGAQRIRFRVDNYRQQTELFPGSPRIDIGRGPCRWIATVDRPQLAGRSLTFGHSPLRPWLLPKVGTWLLGVAIRKSHHEPDHGGKAPHERHDQPPWGCGSHSDRQMTIVHET